MESVDNMIDERINRLASRHIAKCLDYLGDTLAPAQIAAIKRSYRFFADDAKQVLKGETRNAEETSRE